MRYALSKGLEVTGENGCTRMETECSSKYTYFNLENHVQEECIVQVRQYETVPHQFNFVVCVVERNKF